MSHSSTSLKKTERLMLILFLFACFIFYFIWSLHNEYNTSPDEAMRYDVIRYMYEEGDLPDGFTESIRTEAYGYSYAYFATFLGALLSTFFMRVAALFSADTGVLLMAARMTTLISGILTLFFLYLSLRKLFSLRVSIACTSMLAMMPQYAFICTYINNDVLCVFGSSLILYGWICVLERGWTVSSTLITGFGIIVIALSYYNGGAWIMMSIFFFFIGFYLHRKKAYWEPRHMWRMCGLIVAFVFAGVGYFYIRNMVLYDGDMFGISAMREGGRLYGIPELYPENRLTGYNQGLSLFQLFFTPTVLQFGWLKMSYFSFIGVLGPMTIYLPMWIYKFYTAVFMFGGIGFLIRLVTDCRQIHISPKGSDERVRTNMQLLFFICLMICILIPFGLSVYYSYFMDYQPQGRYLYPGITAFITILGIGFHEAGERLTLRFQNHYKNLQIIFTVLTVLFVTAVIAICIYSYNGFYLSYDPVS